jgi:hypothetical protein
MATALNPEAVELQHPGPPVLADHTLEGFCLESGCRGGIEVSALAAGPAISVVTRHSTYRLIVLNPDERRVTMTGGTYFPEPIEVRVDGATGGGSALKIGWIGVGLRLELSAGRRRICTSRVTSIAIDAVPSAATSRYTL